MLYLHFSDCVPELCCQLLPPQRHLPHELSFSILSYQPFANLRAMRLLQQLCALPHLHYPQSLQHLPLSLLPRCCQQDLRRFLHFEPNTAQRHLLCLQLLLHHLPNFSSQLRLLCGHLLPFAKFMPGLVSFALRAFDNHQHLRELLKCLLAVHQHADDLHFLPTSTQALQLKLYQ